MVTTVYIIRHCEAEGNLTGVFQGSTNFDISKKGEKQLEKLAERCKDINFDIVYSSPLVRARKTAQAAIKFSKAEIIIDNGLAEINGGDMECKPWTKLNELFPDEYTLWNNCFHKFSAPGGEAVLDVYNRMIKTFKNTTYMNKSKTIGIFSHGCAIRILMCYIKGIPLERIDEVKWADNTSITRIDIDNYGKMTIVYENDYAHIMNTAETAANRMWWGEQG